MTDFVYEVVCTGERRREEAVRRWLETVAAPAWTALPGLSALDVYVMAEDGTHDPFVDDGAGPLSLAMLHFPSAEAMIGALSSPAFARGLEHRPDGVAFAGTAFERHVHPVAGDDEPAPLTAPFSYVVRYHRPAEDEAEFVAHYLADHPPILGKLPQIRSVLCYVPRDALAPPILPGADYMLGNEVVFDTPQHFNAAMASPVRHELRAHFRSFPNFTGRNTHYPMMRRRLPGRRA
jgi:hypothetical protein